MSANAASQPSVADYSAYKTVSIQNPKPFVFHVQLNRPDKLNAFNRAMWQEVYECFNSLSENPDCRAIVLSAAGKLFTAGLDLKDAMSVSQDLADIDCVGRRGQLLERKIKQYQVINGLSKCIQFAHHNVMQIPGYHVVIGKMQ